MTSIKALGWLPDKHLIKNDITTKFLHGNVSQYTNDSGVAPGSLHITLIRFSKRIL